MLKTLLSNWLLKLLKKWNSPDLKYNSRVERFQSLFDQAVANNFVFKDQPYLLDAKTNLYSDDLGLLQTHRIYPELGLYVIIQGLESTSLDIAQSYGMSADEWITLKERTAKIEDVFKRIRTTERIFLWLVPYNFPLSIDTVTQRLEDLLNE